MNRSSYNNRCDNVVLKWKYIKSIEWLWEFRHIVISTDNKEYLVQDADCKIWDSICVIIHQHSPFLHPSLRFNGHENVLLSLRGDIRYKELIKENKEVVAVRGDKVSDAIRGDSVEETKAADSQEENIEKTAKFIADNVRGYVNTYFEMNCTSEYRTVLSDSLWLFVVNQVVSNFTDLLDGGEEDAIEGKVDKQFKPCDCTPLDPRCDCGKYANPAKAVDVSKDPFNVRPW